VFAHGFAAGIAVTRPLGRRDPADAAHLRQRTTSTRDRLAEA
jgi:hypothetical protein